MESPTPKEMAAAVGGEFVEVTYLDGKKEQVLVHQLPLRTILKDWSIKVGDEAALVELYCNKEEGWDNTLTIASHEKLLEIGERLNDPTFAAWTQRQTARIAKQKERLDAIGISPQTLPDSSSTAAPV